MRLSSELTPIKKDDIGKKIINKKKEKKTTQINLSKLIKPNDLGHKNEII